MPRTDGRKLVALAATATVGALGFATLYLPFVADRDKLRGLFEEEDAGNIPEGARREIRAAMKADAERERRLQEQQGQQQQPMDEGPQQQPQKATAGSMWGSFRRNL
ncbi:hypothetical protein ACHAXT_007178 [Thalassiosira profunda]